MTSEEVANAVLDWIVQSASGLVGSYDHIPASTTEPLPDVVVDVARVETTDRSTLFPQLRIQQVWFRVFTVEASFMVDNADPGAAAQQLRGFEAAVTAELMQDGTLGRRVPMVSPYHSFDYTPPFVERPDGIRGREMTMQLSVGEPLGGPE